MDAWEANGNISFALAAFGDFRVGCFFFGKRCFFFGNRSQKKKTVIFLIFARTADRIAEKACRAYVKSDYLPYSTKNVDLGPGMFETKIFRYRYRDQNYFFDTDTQNIDTETQSRKNTETGKTCQLQKFSKV